MENGRPQTPTTTFPHTTSLPDVTTKRTWYWSLWTLVWMHTKVSLRDLSSLVMEHLSYGFYMTLVIIVVISAHTELGISPETPLPTLTGDCPSCVHVAYANITPAEPLLDSLGDLFRQSEPYPVKFQHFASQEDIFNAYKERPDKYVVGLTIPDLDSALTYTLPLLDGFNSTFMKNDIGNTFIFHCNHTSQVEKYMLRGRCPTLMAYTERAFYNLFRDNQNLPRLQSPLPLVTSPTSLTKHVIGLSPLTMEKDLGYAELAFAMCFAMLALSSLITAVINHINREKKSGNKVLFMMTGIYESVYLGSIALYRCVSGTVAALLTFVIIYATGLLAKVEWYITLGLILLYTLSTVSVGVIMAIFIQGKARAELLGQTYVLLSVIIYTLTLSVPFFPNAKYCYGFFLPPVAMLEGLIFLFMKQDNYLVETKDSIDRVFLLLTLSSLFYYFLGWYLHSVFPGSKVRSTGWLFPFTPRYWFPSRFTPDRANHKPTTETTATVEMSTASHGEYQSSTALENPMIEKSCQLTASHRSQPVVSMKGLYKEFKRRKTKNKEPTDDNDMAPRMTSDGKHILAVNNLCLDFHGGEITGLLGHNGAGKSTAVSILSTLILPTRGQVNTMGFRLPNAGENQAASYGTLKELQSFISLCPQDNIFMEHLTGYENLEFYFNLRGLVVKNDCQKSTGEVRKQYIHEFLAKVRLLDFADQPVSTYSGGMKRRLAIAIALMGDPWLVLLDEPTTGMDVYSLQYIWEFIQERKADHRAIVLTTHGMEEADVLSDRLAIMNRGELSAYGSPLYLKSQLGSGYTLALTKDTEQESGKRLELLHELICSYVPNASIAKDSEQDLVYKLPIESNAPVLSRLFNELEDSIPDANLGISAVGLSMTSLEDVFLRLHSDD